MGYYQVILDQETADELLEFAKRTYWQHVWERFKCLVFWALPRVFWHGSTFDRVFRKDGGFWLRNYV